MHCGQCLKTANNDRKRFCDDYGPADCAAISCTSLPTMTPTNYSTTTYPTTAQPSSIPPK